jgi:hypothetical protein
MTSNASLIRDLSCARLIARYSVDLADIGRRSHQFGNGSNGAVGERGRDGHD